MTGTFFKSKDASVKAMGLIMGGALVVHAVTLLSMLNIGMLMWDHYTAYDLYRVHADTPLDVVRTWWDALTGWMWGRADYTVRPTYIAIISVFKLLFDDEFWAFYIVKYALYLGTAFGIYHVVQRLTQQAVPALLAATIALLMPAQPILMVFSADMYIATLLVICVSLCCTKDGWKHAHELDRRRYAWFVLAAFFLAGTKEMSLIFLSLFLLPGFVSLGLRMWRDRRFEGQAVLRYLPLAGIVLYHLAAVIAVSMVRREQHDVSWMPDAVSLRDYAGMVLEYLRLSMGFNPAYKPLYFGVLAMGVTGTALLAKPPRRLFLAAVYIVAVLAAFFAGSVYGAPHVVVRYAMPGCLLMAIVYGLAFSGGRRVQWAGIGLAALMLFINSGDLLRQGAAYQAQARGIWSSMTLMRQLAAIEDKPLYYYAPWLEWNQDMGKMQIMHTAYDDLHMAYLPPALLPRDKGDILYFIPDEGTLADLKAQKRVSRVIRIEDWPQSVMARLADKITAMQHAVSPHLTLTTYDAGAPYALGTGHALEITKMIIVTVTPRPTDKVPEERVVKGFRAPTGFSE